MQGTSPAQHGVMDAELWLGVSLPSGSVYAFLAEHRRELFPDAMFADLFPSPLGRPSVPADVVAAVLVLQALQGLSDREAAEALTFDLRWKAAAGWPVAAAGFHPTVLTYWRRRLAASGRPDRIFDAVREVVAATGGLSGRAPAAAVLHGAGGRGGHPGHHHPADRRDPPGGTRAARRRRAGRGAGDRVRARLHAAGQAAHRLG